MFVFSVQAEVIPAILESVSSGLLLGPGGYRPRDICVSAPTGSGKTLAFVIPVVQVQVQTMNNIHAYICIGMCSEELSYGVYLDDVHLNPALGIF